MKIQSNFKFEIKDKYRWQLCADKTTRGNLTLWIEMQCNKTADKFLGKQSVDTPDSSNGGNEK